MEPSVAAGHLENLRKSRALRPLPESIARDLGFEARSLKKIERAVGSIGQAWNGVVPAEIARHTAIERFSRGTLTIRVSDASAKYELDRYLRAGGLDRLRAAAQAPIARCKLVQALSPMGGEGVDTAR